MLKVSEEPSILIGFLYGSDFLKRRRRIVEQ
jgi:hypothetical protein